MLRIGQLKLSIDHSEEELRQKVKKILRCKEEPEITIIRRSVDARKKPELFFSYVLNVKVKNEKEIYQHCDKKQVVQIQEKPYVFPVKNYQGNIRPVIIGTGPAGLFCGYMLAQAGYKPILLERGKDVDERTEDVKAFWEGANLNPESNVQFGEGGAGTFSDGKLNTLVKDKYGRNKEVLSIFVKEGAPEEILYDYKPHIGTDVLTEVVRNMRKQIICNGGEVRFQAKVTGFEVENGQVKGVWINDKERLCAEYVVLAVGHSARDTFQVLYDMGIEMEAKPFAVGFRVEHPQDLINLSQYGRTQSDKLGSAPYKVTARTSLDRGVYSFCMCPGGYVVNASSENGRLAINGMSYSGRDGKNANSAIIISVSPEDFESEHPLAGIAFQRKLEEKAYHIGGGAVPIEKYGEFKKAVLKEKENKVESTQIDSMFDDTFRPSIKGAFKYAPVHEIMTDEMNRSFVEGMEHFGKIIPGFCHDKVLVEGIESRTSSPLRILRDEETLQTKIKGIYPCGEGAGYAGGITSAAMDGIKVAEAIAGQLIY